jgi:hypothetical protein
MRCVLSSVVGSVLSASQVAGGELRRRRMSKKRFARVARLAREIAVYLIPILRAIKLIIEILSKAANCNDPKLQVQIP